MPLASFAACHNEILNIAQILSIQTTPNTRKVDLLRKIMEKFPWKDKGSGGLKPSEEGAALQNSIPEAELAALQKRLESLMVHGTLEVASDGFGFLRSAQASYLPTGDDIYVPSHLVKEWHLKSGDTLEGTLDLPKGQERYLGLARVSRVNGEAPSKGYVRPFESLTPIFPDRKIALAPETCSPDNDRAISLRLLDLVAPLGFGQRSLIVAPPRTGKTVFLQNIARSIVEHNPQAHLIILLIDERPEEVTDMKKVIGSHGEVISSTFDEPPSRHVHVVEMVIEKGKRLAERKKDAIILLDSITRLSRAYNAVEPSSGKVLTGGVDANALQKPKRFFGAARNLAEGGSLTIIATALIDTGSKMDEVIFEEFKGTGNQEIVLDRFIAERRLFPAINIKRSGTRREELLMKKEELSKMWLLRRVLSPMGDLEGLEFMISKLKATKNNGDFFLSMGQGSPS